MPSVSVRVRPCSSVFPPYFFLPLLAFRGGVAGFSSDFLWA